MTARALRALLLGVALLAACSGGDQEAETLPESVQEELPLDVSLGNLCPGAESPPEVLREVERKAEALLRELASRPDGLVTYTLYTEEEGPVPQEMTVREVAEIQLGDLRSVSGDGYCVPELGRRLEDAIS